MFFLLTLVSGIVIAIYVYFTWHFDHWAKKGIPGPNARFFFGNFPSNVTQSRNMVYDADDIYQLYRGKFNFVGFYHMRAPGLMALNPETFRNFHDNEFADMGDKEVDKMFSRNPFMLQGDEWKEKRAEITPAFTPARIKTMFPVIEDVCQRMNTYVQANNKDAIEVREMCAKYATDVVSSCIFGLDAESFTTEKPLIREMGIKLMNPTFTAILYFILIEILPFMRHIIRMPFVPKEVETFFVNLMRDAILLRKKNKIERVDFLHYLLELQERKGLKDIDMVAHAVTFFLDGFETSSVAMSYALYELAKNPDCQDKLRSEIRETERLHGKITFEHLLEMPYLEQ
uniref:Cytochrome n=1 Tax=Lutzomyia longipalpis TaxID=7200 RepID=A0A1B0CGS0_LUTLO